jgi:hypothetical protein
VAVVVELTLLVELLVLAVMVVEEMDLAVELHQTLQPILAVEVVVVVMQILQAVQAVQAS